MLPRRPVACQYDRLELCFEKWTYYLALTLIMCLRSYNLIILFYICISLAKDIGLSFLILSNVEHYKSSIL